jgi:hypothetical protein
VKCQRSRARCICPTKSAECPERELCNDGAEEPDQQGEEKAHGLAMLLHLENAMISARMGFPRTTERKSCTSRNQDRRDCTEVTQRAMPRLRGP